VGRVGMSWGLWMWEGVGDCVCGNELGIVGVGIIWGGKELEHERVGMNWGMRVWE
jgi:hypothetical protein